MEEKKTITKDEKKFYPIDNPDENENDCRHCHNGKIDKSEGKNSNLCKECREKYIHLRLPLPIKLFLIIITAIFLASLFFMPKTLNRYRVFIEAQKHIDEHEYLYAYNNYLSLLENYQDSIAIAISAAEAAMHAQYFENAAYIINMYLTDRDLGEKQYSKVTQIVQKLDNLYSTQDKITQILNSNDADVGDQEDIIRLLKVLIDVQIYDKALIYSYIAQCVPTIEDSIEYLKLASEVDVQMTYPISGYGNAMRRIQRFEEAEAIYQHAVSMNACDSRSIAGLGILEMLNGNKTEGLSLISKAYETDPFSKFVPEAYVIALCENGQRKDALIVIKEAETAGYEFEPGMQDYLDGEIGFQQYYIN